MASKRWVGLVDVTKQRDWAAAACKILLLRCRKLWHAGRRLRIFDCARRKLLSRLAASQRLLRAQLGISASGSGRVIQVPSAIPCEGKSTVSATRAVYGSLAGIETVLVDIICDDVPIEGVLRQQNKMLLGGVIWIRSIGRRWINTNMDISVPSLSSSKHQRM